MIKGYPTENGYKGLVDGEYMLFETQEAYYEYLADLDREIEEKFPTVYAVLYACNYASGYKELIGVYDTKQRAEEARNQDIEQTVRPVWNYAIKPITINKTVNITYMEW